MLDYGRIVRIFNEIYWGAADFARCFGESPRYVTGAAGCWQREKQLLPESLLADLRALDVRHFGIATGRSQVELATVLADARRIR